MKNKPVDELMELPYTVEITPDDGSYFAKIKELDGCMTVGETMAEALALIEDAKQAWLTAAVEDDIEIPLPESMQAERYSGRFALRLPKSLHQQLAKGAERDGVSMNQYLVTLLAERSPLAEVRRLLAAQTGASSKSRTANDLHRGKSPKSTIPPAPEGGGKTAVG